MRAGRQADAVQAAQQQAQQGEASRVGPVQVVDHDRQRRPGDGRDEADRGLQGECAGVVMARPPKAASGCRPPWRARPRCAARPGATSASALASGAASSAGTGSRLAAWPSSRAASDHA